MDSTAHAHERRVAPRICTPGLSALVVGHEVTYRYVISDLSLAGVGLGPGPRLPTRDLKCVIPMDAEGELTVEARLGRSGPRRWSEGRQGMEFQSISDDDSMRLEEVLQRFAPWVRWAGHIWISGDVRLTRREQAEIRSLQIAGFTVELDTEVTHLPDDGTTTDVIVSARSEDLTDAMMEVRSALSRHRVVGLDSGGDTGTRSLLGPSGLDTSHCSACEGTGGLIITGRVPLLCASCLSVSEHENTDMELYNTAA